MSSSNYANAAEDVPQAEAAWEWFNKMGAPKLWVAPMVDQSELPFRMLCRNHGSTAAYTPMLHARLFMEKECYRNEHFTTTDMDRPLFAQFCANDPDILLAAAQYVEPHVDGVDINLGCPQRIARKGKYGAFLMDHQELVESLVRKLATELNVPVTVKIRRYDDVDRTVAYAAMLERAGASLVAIHGRTREEKKSVGPTACWDTIKAVKSALRIPVLANGNIHTHHDVAPCMDYTGCDGVLSAEALLADPALFAPKRLLPGGEYNVNEGPQLLLEYLELCEKYPVHYRMIKGHTFKLLGPWLTEFIDLREQLNTGMKIGTDEENRLGIKEITEQVIKRIEETRAKGRDYPIPQISERKLAKMAADAARAAAIAEQDREEQAVQELEGVTPPALATAGAS
jgi:tRNA-dihydrouridine synthase 1